MMNDAKENLINPNVFQERFEDAVRRYMEKYKISQGVCCVSRGDEVLVHLGFGTDIDTIFRIASITKSFTRAAIEQLKTLGKIDNNTKVFPLLGLEPLPGENYNKDLDKITLAQVVNHQAGWDQEVMGDITFNRPLVARMVGKTEMSVEPLDVVRYMLSKPLQYEPGTRGRVYCNFGYVLLGRVIGKVSGQTYLGYIHDYITAPLGLDSIQPAYTSKDKSLVNEATYEKDSSGDNPNEDPYKDVPFEMVDSAGGLVSNSLDLAKFFSHFWADGRMRNGEQRYFNTQGRCVGTLGLVVQRKDGINIVVLFNNRHNRDSKKDLELMNIVEKTVDESVN